MAEKKPKVEEPVVESAVEPVPENCPIHPNHPADPCDACEAEKGNAHIRP